MNEAKYIGMDVHQATISAAVRDSSGNLVMEATLETKAGTILQFIRGLGGSLRVPRYRAEWLAKITEAGVRRRAEICYQQFDALAALRQETRRELLAESRKHPAMRLLRQIPSIGPIRAALLIALMQTPPVVTKETTKYEQPQWHHEIDL